jgi:AcrR family transcriptional regulator
MTELPSWRLKRRQAIVAAAARLFAREPFERVQMDEIAEAAQVGKPTLYRYFPSKQDLYLAVCEDAFEELETRLVAAAEGCAPAAALKGMIQILVTFLDEQMSTLDVFNQDTAPLPDRWRALFRRHRQAIAAPLRAVLKAGLEQSEFHNLDLEIAPGLIIGTIRGGLINNAQIPRGRLVEQLTAFVLSGLGAAQGNLAAAAQNSPLRARGFGVS